MAKVDWANRLDADGNPKPEFEFDAKLRRYRRDGKLLTQEQTIALRDGFIAGQREVAEGLAELLRSGEIGLATWEREFQARVSRAYIAEYLLGRGGTGGAQVSEFGQIGERIKGQYEYARGFAIDIGNGELSADAIANRSQMYFDSSRQAFGMGEAFAWNIIGLPAFPGDGQTRCRTACKCRWKYEEDDDFLNAFWTLAAGENCEDCISNSRVWAPYAIDKTIDRVDELPAPPGLAPDGLSPSGPDAIVQLPADPFAVIDPLDFARRSQAVRDYAPDLEAQRQTLIDATTAVIDQADDAEVAAIKRYLGTDYRDMNKIARGLTDEIDDVLLAAIRDADALLAREDATIAADLKAWRGMKFTKETMPAEFANAAPGTVLTDMGFGSYSLDAKWVDKWFTKPTDSVTLEVVVPKGARGIFGTTDLNYIRESEIVLERGSSLLVHGVERDDLGNIRIIGEILGKGA